MMVEVGGDLPKADQRRLLDLKLLLDKPINGSPCRVLTQEFFSSNQAPAVLYNPEHRLLGIFNHSAKETIAGTFNIKDADGKLADISKIYEFWTGETISLSDGKISYELPPLASIGYRL